MPTLHHQAHKKQALDPSLATDHCWLSQCCRVQSAALEEKTIKKIFRATTLAASSWCTAGRNDCLQGSWACSTAASSLLPVEGFVWGTTGLMLKSAAQNILPDFLVIAGGKVAAHELCCRPMVLCNNMGQKSSDELWAVVTHSVGMAPQGPCMLTISDIHCLLIRYLQSTKSTSLQQQQAEYGDEQL